MKTVIILFFVIWCGAAAVAAGVILAYGFWYIAIIPAVLFCIGLHYCITAVKAVDAPPEPAAEVDAAEVNIEENMKRLRLERQQFDDNGTVKPTSYHNIDITITSPAEDMNQLCDLLHKNYRGKKLKYDDIMNNLQNLPMKIWLQFDYDNEITEFKTALDKTKVNYTAEDTGRGLRDEYKLFLAQNKK